MAGKDAYGRGNFDGTFLETVKAIYEQDVTAPTQARNLFVAACAVPGTGMEIPDLSRLVDRIAEIAIRNKNWQACGNAVMLLTIIGEKQDPAAALKSLQTIAQRVKDPEDAADAIFHGAVLLEINPRLATAEAYLPLTRVQAKEGAVTRLKRRFGRASSPDPVDSACVELSRVVNRIKIGRIKAG